MVESPLRAVTTPIYALKNGLSVAESKCKFRAQSSQLAYNHVHTAFKPGRTAQRPQQCCLLSMALDGLADATPRDLDENSPTIIWDDLRSHSLQPGGFGRSRVEIWYAESTS